MFSGSESNLAGRINAVSRSSGGRRVNAFLKRGFDLVLAALGLVLAAPAMGLIAFLVYVESPGNVIFSQVRLGRHGKTFRMHKFRKFPAHWKDSGPGVTVACDARMTRMGAVLERLKFDELPQLWNILKGEMSFAGPRPESTRFADCFTGRYTAVLDYLPGIFGPNQVAFRNECELYPPERDPEAYYREVLFPQKAENDLRYFENANILKDVVWIAGGLWASVSGVLNWKRFLGLHSKIILCDALAVAAAWTLAHVLRFLELPAGGSLAAFYLGLWLLPLVVVFAMFVGRCYLRPVRFFSLADAIRLIQVVSFALLIGFLIILRVHRGTGYSLLPLTFFLLMPFLASIRAFARIRWEKEKANQMETSKKIAVYGAGRGGVALANWLNNGSLVGFLDDDPVLRGKYVCGCRVMGRESDLPTVHEVHRFDELWVTFRPDETKKKRLQKACKQRGVQLFIIPELEPFARFVSFGNQTISGAKRS